MLRPCFPWMLLMAGDFATLGLPVPGPPPLPAPSPPPPPPLLMPPEAEELLRFFPSRRPSEEWWLKLVWCSDDDKDWRWTNGPRERVESLLFITTLIRLMDSAGLPEGGPRAGGPEEPPAEPPEASALRLRELVRTLGPQLSPMLWTPLWEKDIDDDRPNELCW